MRSVIAAFLLVCFLAGQVVAEECPCGDSAPTTEYTCEQQREFGQCSKDWMISGNFCLCSCGRCKVEAKETEPELVLADDLPQKPKKPSLPTTESKPKTDVDDAEEKEATAVPTTEVTAVPTTEVTAVPTTEVTAVPTAESVDLAPKKKSSLKPLKKLGSKKCTRSPADVIAAASELTSFSALLAETALSEELQDEKAKMTIFAPTDEAFENFGVAVKDLAKKPDVISALVGYHIVPKPLTSKGLAKPVKFDTASGAHLFGGSSKEIEGLGSSAKIIGSAVHVCGSLIYLIDEVLLPAATLDKIGQSEKGAAKAGSELAKPKRPECKKEFDAFFAISSDEDLTMLTEAMNAAELSDDVADPKNQYTILAPTNAAFKDALQILGISFESLLKDLDTLRGILLYHIIDDNIEGDEFVEGPTATLNTTTFYVEAERGIEFAGMGSSATAIETDIDLACNSAVHKVDMVLLPFKVQSSTIIRSSSNPVVSKPPAKGKPGKVAKKIAKAVASRKKKSSKKCQVGTFSVYEVINRNPQLKIFSQVLQLSNAISLFTDKSLKVTIFAPVDYAFGNLLEPGQGFFDLVPDQKIAEALISYHTTGAPVLSRRLSDGLTATTKLTSKGKALRLKVLEAPESPTKISIKGAASSANIIKTDIIGCNSVIHIVDSVLLPSSKLLPGEDVPLRTALLTAEKFTSLLKVPEIENKKD